MGTVNAKGLKDPSNVPAGTWGTVSFAHAEVTIPGGTAIDDTVDFIRLPTGARPIDSFMQVGGGTTAGDLRLGLKGADGSEQDDDDHFNGDKSLNAAETFRRDSLTGFPRLDGDHFVRGTVKANATDADVKVVLGVWYVYEGTE